MLRFSDSLGLVFLQVFRSVAQIIISNTVASDVATSTLGIRGLNNVVFDVVGDYFSIGDCKFLALVVPSLALAVASLRDQMVIF
ncbi:hypothetical protein AMTR_s00001p00247980 [Amborella trichopoda]|uniref:Uncharacterized protein n=1 Tax=Amborella trichopoda TaxID=13333 RepID=W1NKS6_AMBTC|nr:hypothetical protein AMTR_s00001p00247980 [Amborella trichopoda]